MNEVKSAKISRLLANNWVITLTATLIGVFAALYLNEWVSQRNLHAQKKVATKNVLQEISSNRISLEKTIIKQSEMLEIMTFLSNNIDEEKNLIVASDTMRSFKAKFPEVVTLEDSTLLADGKYKYEGEVYMDLTFPHLDLTNITYGTLKGSGLSTHFSFDCLMYLETIDKIVIDIKQKNQELLAFLTGEKDSGKKNTNLIKHLKLLLNYEKSLMGIYENSEEDMNRCN